MDCYKFKSEEACSTGENNRTLKKLEECCMVIIVVMKVIMKSWCTKAFINHLPGKINSTGTKAKEYDHHGAP